MSQIRGVAPARAGVAQTQAPRAAPAAESNQDRLESLKGQLKAVEEAQANGSRGPEADATPVLQEIARTRLAQAADTVREAREKGDPAELEAAMKSIKEAQADALAAGEPDQIEGYAELDHEFVALAEEVAATAGEAKRLEMAGLIQQVGGEPSSGLQADVDAAVAAHGGGDDPKKNDKKRKKRKRKKAKKKPNRRIEMAPLEVEARSDVEKLADWDDEREIMAVDTRQGGWSTVPMSDVDQRDRFADD